MAVGFSGISDKTIERLNKVENIKVGFLTLGTALAIIATIVFIVSTYRTGKLTSAQLAKLRDEGYESNTIVDKTVQDLEKLIGA